VTIRTSTPQPPRTAHPRRSPAPGRSFDHLKLLAYVLLWYFFNVQYNIANKKLLKLFGAPLAVSWLQLVAGVPVSALMWVTGIVKRPSVTQEDVKKLGPAGAFFAAGQVATVASLSAVAVSFTHVVKALEPAVNAIGSAMILGQVFHPCVYLSLVPIFAGVAIASASELSFTMNGFIFAMVSNLCFVARNVLATKQGDVGDMGEDKTTRKTNQLAVLTWIASAVWLPLALAMPGGLLEFGSAWGAAREKGASAGELYSLFLQSGILFFLYQTSSFWVLSCVQPLTHSVLNTLKRVVVIVSSIIFFRNPVTSQGYMGTTIAIGGVLLYSLVKERFSQKKTEPAGTSPAPEERQEMVGATEEKGVP